MAFLLSLLFILPASAQKLSQLVHQATAQYPCWEILQPEMRKLVDRADKCGIEVSYRERVLSAPASMSQLGQTIIFDLAAYEHKSRNRCLGSVLNTLSQSKGKENLREYWAENTSTLLAEAIYYEGQAAQFRRDQKVVDRDVQRLLRQPGRPAQANRLKNNPANDFESEAKSVEQIAKTYRQEIAFSQTPYVENFLENFTQELFGSAPEGYPTDKAQILQKVKTELSKRSQKFFTQFEQTITNESNRLNSQDEGYRVELLKNGFVRKALLQVSPSESVLHQKLMNCAEGEVGKTYQQIEDIKTNLTFIGGGAFGLLNFGVKKSVQVLSQSFLSKVTTKAGKALVGATVVPTAVLGPQEIVNACAKESGFAMSDVPKDCDSKDEIEAYLVKYFKGQSCALSILMNIP